MKYLPPEMSDWYFPFNWHVKELWEIEGSIDLRDLKELEWHMEKPFWSSRSGAGMLFDLKPKDVLAEPDKYPYHSARIKNADTSYPIYLARFKGREIIIDGLHRLAKMVSEKLDVTEVKVIDGNSFHEIATL